INYLHLIKNVHQCHRIIPSATKCIIIDTLILSHFTIFR
ncbi:hypothetical protein TNCT_245951, partial [Trichonephila clavata]